ncbi:chemotaxis protein CheB [Leisingera aquaemixtae]|uniref:Chemotaxis protein methyltransferase n=1 Tax=Leisingera aquaemixtae TaxID=1396826 RepID=A0A0P1H608_9RHOB|nr:chemotaxis protein CheB [Leisingera aquaemixtae]CUH98325.1 Chemotaxis protein methyltransferase [Leisingera aquaemixtae]
MANDETSAPPVIGVGASAGGLEAIREMLSAAGPDTGLAFVIVQHLDPNHESMMAELLGRQTPLPVKQVSGGERVDANHVYVIPPGRGLAIKDGCLRLHEFKEPRGLRRPIDDFFASLARDQEHNAACVILSGTGADGTSGLRAIKEHGGLCVAQEPDTAGYDGMPVSAIGTGLVDFVRDPGSIVACLRTFFDRSSAREEREKAAEVVADHVDEMCASLRKTVGHDFSGYKKSTLVRRIERRMQVLGITQPSAYLERIGDDADECEALFRDLLINVTRFFRDPEMFEELNRRVILPMVERATAEDEIRVWVPGCSSGEEAYSIAVLFADALASRIPRPLVQIFATDIDESMLSLAREGRYPVSALADIPERLREHFTIGKDGIFQMAPKVRDLIRFSSHSLVKDPPFSKLDLISCRNLLIYMGDRLQQQVFPIFHYALNPGGHLFLGPSESIGRHEELFSVTDQKSRIYKRLEGRPFYPFNLPASVAPAKKRSFELPRFGESSRLSWEESVSVRRLVEHYTPASMVVDTDGGVIKTYGRLAKYFEYPSPGRDITFAVSLARPGLRDVLPQMIRQAATGKKRVVARDVTVQAEFGQQVADVVADPLPDGNVLLVFRDAAPFEPGAADDMLELGPADSELQVLQDELRLTRHRLRGTVEELETANEELKSSNEEMMSMNEELQSTNEELTTVNDELKTKVDQLTMANSDLRNFFESTRLAVVVLDRNLQIRSFTEAAKSVFPLKDNDRGRPLTEVASLLENAQHIEDARTVLMGDTVPARTVASADGERQWALRVLPYRLQDGTIDGATVVFNDITEALRMQQDLDLERERLQLAVEVAQLGVWEYHAESGETFLDERELALFGVSGGGDTSIDTLMELILDEDRPGVEASLRRAIAGDEDFSAAFRIRLPDGSVRHLRGLGRLVDAASPVRMIGVSFDVSPEARLAEQRELLIREMNHRVKNLFAIIGGFVSGAARTANSPAELARDVRARIEALGRSHSLTQSQNGTGGVQLKDLIECAVRPHAGNARTALSGPDIVIDIEQLTPLALLFHEWTTNSAKYGAFRPEGGRVDVTWEKVPGNALEIAWKEEPEAQRKDNPSNGTGFGSLLVKHSVRQLEGRISEAHTQSSWHSTLTIPLP